MRLRTVILVTLACAGIVPLAERAGELQQHFGVGVIHEFGGGGENRRREASLGEAQGIDADTGMGVAQGAFEQLGFEGVEAVQRAEGVQAGERVLVPRKEIFHDLR